MGLDGRQWQLPSGHVRRQTLHSRSDDTEGKLRNELLCRSDLFRASGQAPRPDGLDERRALSLNAVQPADELSRGVETPQIRNQLVPRFRASGQRSGGIAADAADLEQSGSEAG